MPSLGLRPWRAPIARVPCLPAFCANRAKGLREKELAFTIVVFLSTTEGDDSWKANSTQRS
jgi:hypothetical protein